MFNFNIAKKQENRFNQKAKNDQKNLPLSKKLFKFCLFISHGHKSVAIAKLEISIKKLNSF